MLFARLFKGAVSALAFVVGLIALNFMVWDYNPDAGYGFRTLGGQLWSVLRVLLAMLTIFIVAYFSWMCFAWNRSDKKREKQLVVVSEAKQAAGCTVIFSTTRNGMSELMPNHRKLNEEAAE